MLGEGDVEAGLFPRGRGPPCAILFGSKRARGRVLRESALPPRKHEQAEASRRPSWRDAGGGAEATERTWQPVQLVISEVSTTLFLVTTD